ncbi:MaoC family dehydratase [Neopusillimonas maritima]|jgi:acyl dehydratase|uniref:Acyl dehydratase n=1 Tax=Neopusillimonas maritima TaxID=2026239 RepID=A0ABX9N1Y0_9BURK|nr:MaoC family dehydratase [Neopusillimonas maritima]MAL01570.1 acyl dehydratase [Alcaligenaceae bacterium]RII84304.1 acyl dehydratase [Neopusillimonas maritima]|tara:strand:+ start:582 stop:1022 length:441 start_codon:yes stop_codon:yes gene_type:complete
MKFSEFRDGMVIKHPPVVLDEKTMIDFAKQFDPQWFHTDPEKANNSRWGGLIGSGWLTCSLAMRMAADSALAGSESFGSPGVDKIRWLLPTRPGDALRLELTVNNVRVSETRKDLGIVRWTWRVYNQNDDQVLELEATSLFDLGQS